MLNLSLLDNQIEKEILDLYKTYRKLTLDNQNTQEIIEKIDRLFINEYTEKS